MNHEDVGILQNIHRLDVRTFGWCQRRSSEHLVFRASRWVSRSADGWLYLLLPLLYCLSAGSPAQRFAWLAAAAFSIERLIYWVLKNTCRRRRPPDILPGFRSLITASDCFSFPSGHTCAAFLFAGLCSLEFGPWAACTLYPWATCVGASRVFLGVHFPSDTLAGALLGSAVLIAVTL
jgi:undecaprenyl-diphosphatase